MAKSGVWKFKETIWQPAFQKIYKKAMVGECVHKYCLGKSILVIQCNNHKEGKRASYFRYQANVYQLSVQENQSNSCSDW